MPQSSYQAFWQHDSFAVVGHEARKNFPHLTYRGLREMGKKVFPVDPSRDEIDGDTAFGDLQALPEPVEAAVLEVPKEETRDWVERAADAGIKHIWIHAQRETDEALELARERGLDTLSGTCAVMYLEPVRSYHRIHRWIMKRVGKY